MIELPKPSRVEILCRNGFFVCVLLFVAIWLVVFISMWLDIFSMGMDLLLFLAAAIVIFAARFMKSKSTTLSQERRDVSALLVFNAATVGDIHNFAILLRPFYLTGKVTQEESSGLDDSSKWTYDLESTMVKSLAELMPIVALGRPGEAIGVGRILTDESTWKTAAAELMFRASLIFCIPSAHPGTAWELEQIVQNRYLGKTVFFMPLVVKSFSHLQEQRNDWNLVVELMGRHGIPVPHYREVPPNNRTELGYTLANLGLLLHDLRAAHWRVAPQRIKSAGLLFSVKPEGKHIEEDIDLRYPEMLRDAIKRMTS